MAMLVQERLVGVDVSKADLEIASSDSAAKTQVVTNDRRSILRWIRTLTGRACIVVVATNVFHLTLVEEAYAHGHVVYIVDGFRLNRYRGRRRLTKKGDPELRRLLHNAAMAARKTRRWKPVYEAQLQRGMKPIQALVILARKLARIAFALMRNQSEYISAPVHCAKT